MLSMGAVGWSIDVGWKRQSMGIGFSPQFRRVEARPARTRDLLPFIITLIALATSTQRSDLTSSYNFTITYFVFCPFFYLSYNLSLLTIQFPQISSFSMVTHPTRTSRVRRVAQ
jgi:hypothetical protein